MAAYQYCTGPVYCWAGDNFLGTCEVCPDFDDEFMWEESYNDLSGSKIPFDLNYEGQTCIIVMDLNYFDQSVLTGISVQGVDGPLARGALLVQNNLGFALTLAFSFYGTANAQPGMPPGFFFPKVRTIKAIHSPTGTKVRKVRLIVEAQPIFTFSTGSFFLYSTDPSYF